MEEMPKPMSENVKKIPEQILDNQVKEGSDVEQEKDIIEQEENNVESTLTSFDRIVDWNSSLTSREDLEKLLRTEKQLRIKFGADITAQTLHLGHAVNLRAMRSLQDLGHKVVFLLGGFTTLVGDPTGRLTSRSEQAKKDIELNKKNFIDQVKMVLKLDDPNLLEIHDNTEWWGDSEKHGTVTLGNFFRILGKVTHAQLISRDMFQERIEEDKPIMMSEFLYPILQGYDSVELKSDITIVGSDQMFNEKMAWAFQEAAGQKKQAILCTKITLGLDGQNKQSKSIGNYVGLSHSPQEKFNRTMFLPDNLINEWMEVYTSAPQEELEKCKLEWEKDPLMFKQKLAWYIVEQFHGKEVADSANKEYLEKRQKMVLPSDIPEIALHLGVDNTLIRALVKATGQSGSVVRDAIRNNGVKIVNLSEDGSYQLTDVPNKNPTIAISDGTILRYGKNKWFKFKTD